MEELKNESNNFCKELTTPTELKGVELIRLTEKDKGYEAIGYVVKIRDKSYYFYKSFDEIECGILEKYESYRSVRLSPEEQKKIKLDFIEVVIECSELNAHKFQALIEKIKANEAPELYSVEVGEV